METDKKRMSFEEVKRIDLVDYLSFLGYHPVKIRNADHWYLSPLRTEKTASFKVNRNLNKWYDHGLGEGGGLLHFGALYHRCTRKEFLQSLNAHPRYQSPPSKAVPPEARLQDPSIKIIRNTKLSSFPLLRYIDERRIPEPVATRFCREITFEINHKRHTAIGFRNNEGGFELRNPWFKGGNSPKSVTSFLNTSNEICVFEGFFDFLTYLTICRNQEFAPTDFLVLNSLSFFEKSRSLMEGYERIHLFLDRDKSGKAISEKVTRTSNCYVDESNLYKGYKDLNEWVQQIGKSQSKGIWHLFK
jgi:hypothetical protein